jgi:hypothetical protein
VSGNPAIKASCCCRCSSTCMRYVHLSRPVLNQGRRGFSRVDRKALLAILRILPQVIRFAVHLATTRYHQSCSLHLHRVFPTQSPTSSWTVIEGRKKFQRYATGASNAELVEGSHDLPRVCIMTFSFRGPECAFLPYTSQRTF